MRGTHPEGTWWHVIGGFAFAIFIGFTSCEVIRSIARTAVESAKPNGPTGPLSDETGQGPAVFGVATLRGSPDCYGPSWQCVEECDLPGADCVEFGEPQFKESCGSCQRGFRPTPGVVYANGCPICERIRRVPRNGD